MSIMYAAVDPDELSADDGGSAVGGYGPHDELHDRGVFEDEEYGDIVLALLPRRLWSLRWLLQPSEIAVVM